MKNIQSKLATIALLFAYSLTTVSCGSTEIPNYNLHTELQTKYLEGEYNLISLYAKGTEELSKPEGVLLEWNDFSSNEYEVKISKNENMEEIVTTYVTSDNFITAYNFEINETYYWYAFNSDGKTKVNSFTTNCYAPRSLNIEGLTNARDLGGYSIGEGKYTKQGVIYRTSRFNENETTDLLITESGINEMVNRLKIKSELDIRRVDNNESGGITESPLGSSVNYYSVPMKSGGNCILLNKEVLKDAFAIFGNKDNYPIVMHCSIGTDRTGMLAFLIHALLGVSEEDLYKDYLYSNFANIGKSRSPSTIKDYIGTINSSMGDTFAEKTKNYLIDAGVSEQDINTLIEMMI